MTELVKRITKRLRFADSTKLTFRLGAVAKAALIADAEMRADAGEVGADKRRWTASDTVRELVERYLRRRTRKGVTL